LISSKNPASEVKVCKGAREVLGKCEKAMRSNVSKNHCRRIAMNAKRKASYGGGWGELLGWSAEDGTGDVRNQKSIRLPLKKIEPMDFFVDGKQREALGPACVNLTA